MALELADSVDHNGSPLGGVSIGAIHASIHFPEFHRTLGTGEPLLQFARVTQGFEHAFRGSGYMDLTDDGILFGSDFCRHEVSLLAVICVYPSGLFHARAQLRRRPSDCEGWF